MLVHVLDFVWIQAYSTNRISSKRVDNNGNQSLELHGSRINDILSALIKESSLGLGVWLEKTGCNLVRRSYMKCKIFYVNIQFWWFNRLINSDTSLNLPFRNGPYPLQKWILSIHVREVLIFLKSTRKFSF